MIAVAEFQIGAIDELVHGRMRLGILTYLASAHTADFNTLKSVLGATQGNLSVHLTKLEGASYVSIEKSFRDRKPLTRVRITEAGRRALRAYFEAMNKFIVNAENARSGE